MWRFIAILYIGKHMLYFWNVLPICFDKRECAYHLFTSEKKIQNFATAHAIDIKHLDILVSNVKI